MAIDKKLKMLCPPIGHLNPGPYMYPDRKSKPKTLFDIIKTVILIPDINKALYELQTFLGVESGDVAGIHFSGFDDIETTWKTADKTLRLKIIADYIKSEITFPNQF